MEYLQRIHDLHEKWLGDDITGMVIDGEKEF